MKFSTALIDGDILIYRVGFTTQETVVGDDGSTVIVPLPADLAVARMRSIVYDIGYVAADAKRFRGFLSPRGETFRHRIAKTLPYKGTRVMEKPVHYQLLRDFLHEGLGFQYAVDEEADDLLGIALKAGGEGSVCVTLDKDLNNVPGWHLNFVRNELSYVTPEEAAINFGRQVLTGDSTDNIPGLFKHYGVRFGPKSAEQAIPDGTRPEDVWELVMRQYKDREAGLEKALETASLVWIRHEVGQIFTPEVLLNGR
jgi:hypothetical protein